jgi:hypothetical protein
VSARRPWRPSRASSGWSPGPRNGACTPPGRGRLAHRDDPLLDGGALASPVPESR